jgi:putative hydrolase of the HAD superfamily
MIRALLLDLDGTLLEEDYIEASLDAACVVIAERTGIPAEALRLVNDRVWPEYWSEIGDQWMRGTISAIDVATEAWRRTLLECGSDDGALVDFAMRIHERLEGERYRLYDDVPGALAAADAAGLAMAVVTNGASRTQRSKLQLVGIEPRFGGIAISGEVGAVKPEPGIFDFALSALGVDAASAVMIGDSLENDIAGARAAGITSVWLNRTGEALPSDAVEPDHVITSLSELPALLWPAEAARQS